MLYREQIGARLKAKGCQEAIAVDQIRDYGDLGMVRSGRIHNAIRKFGNRTCKWIGLGCERGEWMTSGLSNWVTDDGIY